MGRTVNSVQTGLPPKLRALLLEFAERTRRLTPAEWAIFQHYLEGDTLEEIAEEAGISLNTAKKHNTNINRKLEISNREELQLYIEVFRCCDQLKLLSSRPR